MVLPSISLSYCSSPWAGCSMAHFCKNCNANAHNHGSLVLVAAVGAGKGSKLK